MHNQHTLSETGNATGLICRRAVLSGAISLAATAPVAASVAVDEAAWHADTQDELEALIAAYDRAREIDRALGQAFDDLADDPAMPDVCVKMSEIRPLFEISGVDEFYSEECIDEYFDGRINQRRSWAGIEECFEAVINQSRECAHRLIRERSDRYKDWQDRVGYEQHEQRFFDAAARSDDLLNEIVRHPCQCLAHVAAKARFLIEYPSEFRSDPSRLSALLLTFAHAGSGA